MSKARFSIIIVSSIVLVASYLILLATFFNAYLSPIKTVIVNVDNIGEANIEFVFLLASIPCVMYYLSCMRWSSEKRKMWIEVTPDK